MAYAGNIEKAKSKQQFTGNIEVPESPSSTPTATKR